MSDAGAHAIDDGGLSDELDVRLNGERIPQPGEQLPAIGERPADGSTKEKWAAYAVQLGLDATVAGQWTRKELITWCEPPSNTE